MFDTISVSERKRKQWTLAVSFGGQVVLLGLAVLVPLLSTDGLPHRIAWVSVPAPPHALSHHAPPIRERQPGTIPVPMSHRDLLLPAAIPRRVVMTDDTPFVAVAADAPGVSGGIGDSSGSDNSVIDSLTRGVTTPPRPTPVVKQPAAPPSVQRIKVGGKVQEGKLISGPRPVYPQLAITARIEGTVVLDAVIARDGSIIGLRAVHGHPLLIPAALAAVQHWIFRPTTLNGEPVEVATEIEVNFTLRK
jgi:protein TonB